MRKNSRVVCTIVMILCFVALVVTGILVGLGVIGENILKWIIVSLLLVMIVVLLLCGAISAIKSAVRSFKNMNSCGDPLFNEIDSYKHHWGETKEHYEDMINVISYYYRIGGKVERVVGNDLMRLFNRLDFLKQELNTKSHFNTCILSIGLSITASLFVDAAFSQSNNFVIYMLVGSVVFFVSLLFPYSETMKSGSDEIFRYELRLLQKRIEDVEKKIIIENIDEDVLITKQNVLKTLIEKCSKKKEEKREGIIEDIRKIEKLNLHIERSSECEKVRFVIQGTQRSGIILCDKEGKLVNEDYKVLYDVLRKYNLMYQKEEDNKAVVEDDKKAELTLTEED